MGFKSNTSNYKVIALCFLITITSLRPSASFAISIPLPSPSPASSPIPSPSPSPQNFVAQFDRIEEDTVYFTGGAKPIKTKLVDLKYLGRILSSKVEPFFFFSGRNCKETTCPLNLFAFTTYKNQKPINFVYPGSVFDSKKGLVVYRGRAFIGKCISNSTYHNHDVYVVFQEERVDRRNRLQSSVFVTEPDSPYWTEKLITARPLPRIKDTLHWVKMKKCTEITGTSRKSISHPLNIKLPPALEETEDDDTSDAAPDPEPSGDKPNH